METARASSGRGTVPPLLRSRRYRLKKLREFPRFPRRQRSESGNPSVGGVVGSALMKKRSAPPSRSAAT